MRRVSCVLNDEEAKWSQALAAWKQAALKNDLLLATSATPHANVSSTAHTRTSASSSEETSESPPSYDPDATLDANTSPAAAYGTTQANSGDACSIARCGVSLTYLRQFIESLDASTSKDMQSCVQKLLAPITRSEGKFCRFWDLVPRGAVGVPHYFVVHAWGASLKDLLSQLEFCLLGHSHTGGRRKEVYVWLSAFVTSQAQKPTDIELVKEVIKTCSKGMVVIVDPQSLVLSRLWCCYEVWAASYYAEHHKIRVAFPEDISIEQMADYEQACQRLNIMQCDTSKPEDKTMLLSAIKSSVGLKLMTKTLAETLLRSSRVSLRFSESVRGQAMYCALLLKGGEYCRCQQVLCNLESFGLEDDDRMLEEMKGIFKLYDEGGSGELGRTEFAQVLCNTGFEAEEADRIFDEINTDGSGGVSLEEWQEWWLSSHKQEKPKRKRMVMLASGLIDNLEKMVRLMQHHHLDSYASFFREYHTRLHEGGLKPTQVLAASPLKGDWPAVLDQVMFMLHKKLYRHTCKPLYDLLMWNSDSLDFNPRDLPAPQQLLGEPAMMQGLQIYLQLFASILAHQPGRGRHAEYLLKSANTLPLTAKDQDLARRKDAKTKLDKHDAARFTVVRNMITLKYGKDQPLSEHLIAEAEMSLGQMMANKKGAISRDNFADSLQSSYITSSGHRHHGQGASALMSTPPLNNRIDAGEELIEQLAGTVASLNLRAKELAASEVASKGLSLACQSFKRLASSRRVPSEGALGELMDGLAEYGSQPPHDDEPGPPGQPRSAGRRRPEPLSKTRSKSLVLLGSVPQMPSSGPGGGELLSSMDQMTKPRYALVPALEPLKLLRMPTAVSGAGGSPSSSSSPLLGSPSSRLGPAEKALLHPPVGKTRLPSIRWSAGNLSDDATGCAALEDSPRPPRYTSIMRLPSLAETRQADNVVEDLIAKVVRAPSFPYAACGGGSPKGDKSRRMSSLDVMLSAVKDSPLTRALSKASSKRTITHL